MVGTLSNFLTRGRITNIIQFSDTDIDKNTQQIISCLDIYPFTFGHILTFYHNREFPNFEDYLDENGDGSEESKHVFERICNRLYLLMKTQSEVISAMLNNDPEQKVSTYKTHFAIFGMDIQDQAHVHTFLTEQSISNLELGNKEQHNFSVTSEKFPITEEEILGITETSEKKLFKDCNDVSLSYYEHDSGMKVVAFNEKIDDLTSLSSSQFQEVMRTLATEMKEMKRLDQTIKKVYVLTKYIQGVPYILLLPIKEKADIGTRDKYNDRKLPNDENLKTEYLEQLHKSLAETK